MTEPFPEKRHFTQKRFEGGDGFGHVLRIARAVGENDAVGMHGEDVLRSRIVGNDGYVAAAAV